MAVTQIEHASIERLAEIGGHKLVCQMIDLFLTHVPQRIETMLSARVAGDLGAIEKAAHSLKSSAANLGAMNLFQLMSELERFAGEHQQEAVYNMFEPTLACCEQVFDELKDLYQVWANHENHRSC